MTAVHLGEIEKLHRALRLKKLTMEIYRPTVLVPMYTSGGIVQRQEPLYSQSRILWTQNGARIEIPRMSLALRAKVEKLTPVFAEASPTDHSQVGESPSSNS